MTNLESNEGVLSHKMLPDLANLIFKIKPENVSIKAIQDYDAQFNNFDHITAQDFDTLGMKTIHAMDIAIDWFYVASRFAKYAHTQYDKKSANLYIDIVPAKMASQGVKDTDAGRNRFLDQEEDFVSYKEISFES